jgi:hypothetical protein
MKKLLLFFMLIPLFISCSDKEDDYSQKKEQELWLNGYTQWVSKGDVEPNVIRFLFFSANNNEEFEIKNYPSGATSYYEYTKLEEDAIYTQLLEKGELKLKSGESVKSIGDFKDFYSVDKKQLEVKLPVGKYFVVAFYYDRGVRRDYWNKYATTYYTLESRYNPQSLTVVIPGYYNQCGSIPWINWSDAPIEFRF